MKVDLEDGMELPQQKMYRIFKLIFVLAHTPCSIEELAREFYTSERTIYRYLKFIKCLDIELDQTIDENKFFIPHDGCPVCKLMKK